MHYGCSQRLDLLCISVSVELSPLNLLSDAMRRVVDIDNLLQLRDHGLESPDLSHRDQKLSTRSSRLFLHNKLTVEQMPCAQ